MRRDVLRLSALFALLVVGCGDTLDPVSLVTRPRVLGFEPSVEGDAERTTPRPGERVNLTLPFAFPGAAQDIDFVGVACLGVDVGFGIPFCASEEDVVAALANRSEAPAFPTVSFTVPPDFPADGELLVIAAACAGGVVDPELLASALDITSPPAGGLEVCAGGVGTGELLQSVIPLEREPSDSNRRPRPLVEVRLGGRVLVPDPGGVPGSPCSGMGLENFVTDGGDVELVVQSAPDTFDDFFVLDGDDQPVPRVEAMQHALLLTAGEVEANFIFTEREDLVEDTTYTLPLAEERPVGPDGSLERLWLSIRDERGGLRVESRAYCLVPGA